MAAYSGLNSTRRRRASATQPQPSYLFAHSPRAVPAQEITWKYNLCLHILS